MQSFKDYRSSRIEGQLTERFSAPNVDKAMGLILQYLERRLGSLYQMPGVEHFSNSHGEGSGLRFFTSRGKSFRFNWRHNSKGSSKEIASVDVWDGSSHDPNVEIAVSGISLTKILPSLADLIARPEVGEITIVAERAALNGTMLVEARAGANAAEVLDEMIDLFMSGSTFSDNKINQIGRTTALSLWRRIQKLYPTLFSIERNGAKTFVSLMPGVTEDQFNKAEILSQTVTLSSEMGADGERYTSEEIRRVENEARKNGGIPYEDQLDDLNKLVRAVARGASNALFVCGVGGTGKTFKVEEALAQLGMSDGSGYFKNTTSASASGMYKTLYDFRDSIIVFDDCDAVFKDQESRNLLKSATDTRKERKLGWMKSAFWIYKGNPADLEKLKDEDDDDADPFADDADDDQDKKYPKYFNFSGRIIFISNLQLDQLDPDGALRTRGFVISINPTNKELGDFMEKIMDDIKLEGGLQLAPAERRKVLDVLRAGHNSGDMNMRKLVRGMNMAAADIPGWESLVSRYA